MSQSYYMTRDIYSPQATAAKGIRSTTPNRFYSSTGTTPPSTEEILPEEIKSPLESTIYAEPPGIPSEWSVGSDPGAMVTGPDMPSNEALAILGLPTEPVDTLGKGLKAGFNFVTQNTMNPLARGINYGIQKGVKGLVKGVKGIVAQAQGFDSPLQGQEFALDTTPVTNPETGLPAGFIGAGEAAPSTGNIGSGNAPGTGEFGGYEGAMSAQAPDSPLGAMDFGGGDSGASGGSGGGLGGDGGYGFGGGGVAGYGGY